MPQVNGFRVRSDALRELRVTRGLSLKQLGSKTGRHAQSIRRLETTPGKLVGEVFAHQIANALGVDITEFTEDIAA